MYYFINRCKRIVLVLSPDFVETPMCEFMKEYALSISTGNDKKLLPIMYKECPRLPYGLKHLEDLPYHKPDYRVNTDNIILVAKDQNCISFARHLAQLPFKKHHHDYIKSFGPIIACAQ